MLEPDKSCSSDGNEGDVKKVAEVKILSYYKALTEGCGDGSCVNTHCVSSGKITPLTSNEAAVKALHLFSSHAPICSSLSSPSPQNPANTPTNPSSRSISPATELIASTSLGSNQKGSSTSSSSSKMNDPCHGGLSYELLKYTLEQCSVEQSFVKLRVTLRSAFSNEMVLRRSFLQKQIPESPSDHSKTDEKTKKAECKFIGFESQNNCVEEDIAKDNLNFPESLVNLDDKVEVKVMSLESKLEMDVEEVSVKEKLRSSESQMEKDIDSAVMCVEESSEEIVAEGSAAIEGMQVDSPCKVNPGPEFLSDKFQSDSSCSSSTDNQRTMPSSAKEESSSVVVSSNDAKYVAVGYTVLKSKVSSPSVDFDSLHKSYKLLKSVPCTEYTEVILDAQKTLVFDQLALKYRASKNEFERDLKIVDILVILLENPLFIDDNDYTEAFMETLCKFLTLLSDQQKAVLVVYLAKSWSKIKLNSFLAAFHHLITIKLITTDSGIGPDNDSMPYELTICAATKAMHLLFMTSILAGQVEQPLLRDVPKPTPVFSAFLFSSDQQSSKSPFIPKTPEFDGLSELLGIHPLDSRKPLIPFSEFYDEFLSEQLEVDKDYAFYKSDAGKFSFLHHPYILTPATKALALYYDNRIRMFSERRLSVFMLGDGLPATPYLRLRVRRDQIISDALVELEVVAMESPSELRKQLVVEFEGEQGIDEGGVSKEFFQLITDQLFCPDFGMFSEQKETGLMWFNPRSFENEAQFSLVGLILGLAIYNNIILDLHLPPVLYKKLCGKPGTFQDLENWNPTLYRSLLSLLEYEGDDMEDMFMQNFRVGYQDVFGDSLWHNLKEDGENALVGQNNKHEFVQLYSDWLLNSMVEQQFAPFFRGFLMVTEESPLDKLFRPDELELLLCGSQEYDYKELQKYADYDGGYTEKTPVIQWFWDIVDNMSSDDRKQLLQFTTGSARVPVGGLAHLKLVIARHGPDTERLPTAHTCFNVLLLPEYSTHEKLHDRLMKAIQYSQGFGLL